MKNEQCKSMRKYRWRDRVDVDSSEKKLAACVPEGPTLRAVVSNFQLSSFGREKMKFLKLSQMNGLDK